MSTAGFDHRVHGGFGERRAAERQKPDPRGFIILFSKSNERKGSAALLTAVPTQNRNMHTFSHDLGTAASLSGTVFNVESWPMTSSYLHFSNQNTKKPHHVLNQGDI